MRRLECIIFLVIFRLVEGQYNDPHFMEGRSVIVHLFEWKFSTIANECKEYLGPNKFGGVQTSPIVENVISETRSWNERYQPVSYKIISRSGTEAEFKDMVKECFDAGVRVYVDVVLNHMARGDKEVVGVGGSEAQPHNLEYPAVPYTSTDFNKFCDVTNYTDAFQMRNCRLFGLPDLNQKNENVQNEIVKFMNKMLELGVAGFRVDACKHMWPTDLEKIYAKLSDLNEAFGFGAGERPFIYQAVVDSGGEAISKNEYIGMGAITEFMHSYQLSETFRSKRSLHSLLKWGPKHGFVSSEDAVVFVDNQDIQREKANGIILTYKDKKPYKMANIFMLAHPYGTPMIMSSYEFEDDIQGPPADDDFNIIEREIGEDGQCKSPWVCEHRWKEIKNMVAFRNLAGKHIIGNWADNGQNQVAFCRGKLGFIAFNNELSIKFFANLQTCLPEGEYCDILSGAIEDGSCRGTKIIVDANGKADVTIPYDIDLPLLAFHVDNKI